MSFDVSKQHVVVIGAGRSGLAAVELLRSRGARVTLADTRTTPLQDQAGIEAGGVAVELGPHREDLLTTADLIVLSPGVPADQPVLRKARGLGVRVIGEVELASRWLKGRIVAITGTKGKSTTTTLTARMLQEAGIAATAGGNLGVALSSQVDTSDAGSIHVVEVSSFQLESTERFHPWIAVMLNLSPDHLDRHASFDEYAGAKQLIFRNQTAQDWAVVNADDPGTLSLARSGRAQRFDFALDHVVPQGIGIEGTDIVERRQGRTRALMPLSAIRLRGRHLLSDVLAAAAVGVLAGVPADAMERAVRDFGGLEHALEHVADVGGVEFVNDSKATNVIATRRAIESFDGGVVPILGGRYKGGEFADLRDALSARAAGVVVFGEAAELISTSLGGVVPVVRAQSIEDAVRQGYAMASSGGAVVLAPGCSSFDMFEDYADRGRAFKRAVTALEKEIGSVNRD